MHTIAVLSQKGGAGKTTLAVHLAVEAEAAGLVVLLIDMDPQATASTWSGWRKAETPEVIDCPPALLARKLKAAAAQGAELVVIDTPPHAEQAASEAARAADLILIPCRPGAFDLDAIRMTTALALRSGKPAAVVLMAGRPNANRLNAEAADVVAQYGVKAYLGDVPHRADFAHATAEGLVAREYAPDGRAARDIRVLWNWLADRLELPGVNVRAA